MHDNFDLRAVSNQCHVAVHTNFDRRVRLPGKIMDRARSNGAEVLLSGEHNAYGRDKLKIGSEEAARCFYVTVHQGTYAFVLGSPDIISL